MAACWHPDGARRTAAAAFAASADLLAADQHGDVDPASHHRRGAVLRHAAAGLVADRCRDRARLFRLRQRLVGQPGPASSCCSATPGRCIHHMLGGIRHFIWDTGRGFDLKTIDLLSWGTIIVSVIADGR